MQTLRDYQAEGENTIRERYRAGYRRILYVLPTGGGKTTVAASIIRQARQKGSKIVFLAHRKELIDQASARLDGLGVPHGIIMADHPRANNAPVQVASIQTLHRRGLPWEPDLVFVDECHRIRGNSYQQVISDCGRAVVIGITATPCRTDGKGLNPPFESIVLGPSLADLTARGFLVPSKTFARKKPNLSGVHTTAGDYQQYELQIAMNKPEIVGDVVKEWQKHAVGRLTAVFAVGVKHSIALRDAFRAAGVASEHLDGETPTTERERLLRDLSAGKITVLCNCGVLTEGWDCPPVSCVSIVRPTQSLALYLQMAGRALRTADGKSDCVILDHGGCVYRHGLITAERAWSLDGEESRPKGKSSKSAEDMVKVCPDCDSVAELTDEQCPCGYVFKPKRKPTKQVDGELELVTDAKPITEDEKRRKYEWFLMQQYTQRKKGGSPFSPVYAVMKFRAMYGHQPKRGWREAWMEKRREEERRRDWLDAGCTCHLGHPPCGWCTREVDAEEAVAAAFPGGAGGVDEEVVADVVPAVAFDVELPEGAEEGGEVGGGVGAGGVVDDEVGGGGAGGVGAFGADDGGGAVVDAGREAFEVGSEGGGDGAGGDGAGIVVGAVDDAVAGEAGGGGAGAGVGALAGGEAAFDVGADGFAEGGEERVEGDAGTLGAAGGAGGDAGVAVAADDVEFEAAGDVEGLGVGVEVVLAGLPSEEGGQCVEGWFGGGEIGVGADERDAGGAGVDAGEVDAEKAEAC